MIFGKLTIIEKAKKNNEDRDKHDRWLCKCDCGNTTIVRSNCLRKNEIKSCGCSRYKTKDINNQRFGRLIAVKRVGIGSNGSMKWLCLCDCGNETIASQGNLHAGNIKSCGCLHIDKTRMANTTHGLKNTRLYRIWHGMKCRCCNPTDAKFHMYGGKGVKICSQWIYDFQSFYNWALLNGYSDDLTIDRINSSGDYCPENCRWLTRGDNASVANTKFYLTVNGITQSANRWSKLIEISASTVINRCKDIGVKKTEIAIMEIINGGKNTLYKSRRLHNDRRN